MSGGSANEPQAVDGPALPPIELHDAVRRHPPILEVSTDAEKRGPFMVVAEFVT
jgi:hypothetical protein